MDAAGWIRGAHRRLRGPLVLREALVVVVRLQGAAADQRRVPGLPGVRDLCVSFFFVKKKKKKGGKEEEEEEEEINAGRRWEKKQLRCVCASSPRFIKNSFSIMDANPFWEPSTAYSSICAFMRLYVSANTFKLMINKPISPKCC